jgi:hypothetical protein
MNIEQKIAFRKLLSDVLMHMSEPVRTKDELLTVLEKLEKSIAQIVDVTAKNMLSIADTYRMEGEDQIKFRTQIAFTLQAIASEKLPEKILELINNLETWVDNTTEIWVRKCIGKPKMNIRKLPN